MATEKQKTAARKNIKKDAERDDAWRRIKAAARKHGVEVEAGSWRDLTGTGVKGSR
jgi:hypothetical protein